MGCRAYSSSCKHPSHFCCYKSLQLDLAPLTVIIGRNAFGKTSLLRGISLLMQGVDLATPSVSSSNSSWTASSEEIAFLTSEPRQVEHVVHAG
ncbi:AAA family ATPase [Leptolyngbya boryana]|uniref:AAA family ATPase n=1 Tax=Leptolyngbya boryana TaxID=1184 RepID=UPI001181B1E9|nr:AAA family ATPase [Leptolyngbya sp. FACHB-161]MBD2376999.1 AAA family ATPase [Leptolyngbya sp. FACHB-238]MBD2401366.1 AAA family ATPase [Leptolyngbya sp. FACHB-239]MBD2407917.1 AAA family ATPase [Leptolyngbya sp. FACHB-402]